MNEQAIIRAIDLALAGISLLRELGVNYSEVIAAQERADSEGRDLSADERQAFIDQAQAAVGRL